MYGLANMSLFLIEINLLAALFAIQFLGGDIQSGESIDFGTLYNTFLAIYQVFSSENWTDVLYLASVPEVPLRQAAITVIFIAGWMFFANCAWHSSCVFSCGGLTLRDRHRVANVHCRHQREL